MGLGGYASKWESEAEPPFRDVLRQIRLKLSPRCDAIFDSLIIVP